MKPAMIRGCRCKALLLFVVMLLPLLAKAQAISQTAPQTASQPAPLITQPVDSSKRQVIANTVHPMVKRSADQGRVDSSLPMKDMLLRLNTSVNQTTIQQYVASLHNPSAANYHKWLTPEQYAQKFGVADADVKAVTTWLQSNGFTVEQVGRGKNFIRFSGTASQVEDAFQTEIHKYATTTGSAAVEMHYANSSRLSIPSALSPAVAGVVSLNNFFTRPQYATLQKMTRNANGKMQVAPVAASATRNSTGAPQFTTTAGQEANYVTPGDFSTIYDAQSIVSSGINGSGVTIAVVGRSDISISDIEAFRTVSSLPFNDPTITYATTDPGDVSGDDVEASLDVEWAGAIAPQASINYVIGASTNTTDGVDVSSSYIVDNVTAPIMTVSFGACEALVSDPEIAFYHSLWQQAAAEGITVLIAAGDSGASSCNDPAEQSTVYGFGVSALASTPYDTAVGGTEFNDLDAQSTYWNLTNGANQSSVKGYIPETVWNESCANGVQPSQINCLFPPYELGSYAGGGGASSCIIRTTDDSGDEWCAAGEAKPSWQTGTGVPTDGVRDVPDISLAAASQHDPFIFCYQGGCQWTTNSNGSITLIQADLVGGTSDAAPSMASIMALVEQKAGAPLGVANYQLYSLAAAQGNSCTSSNRTDPTQTNKCIFNDITTGSNAVPCFSGANDCDATGGDQPVQVGATLPPAEFAPNAEMDGQNAGTGFDLASGLGSVDVANLVNAWGTLNQAASKTTLTVSQTSFQHGASITLSGAVTAVSGTGTPTGEVVIVVSSGNSAVASIPISSGAFSGSTINLPGGSYKVTASYSGDSNFTPSTSAPIAITVKPENSTVTGTSYAYSPIRFFGGNVLRQTNTALLGYPWYLQFNVAGASGSTALATGNITLTSGSTTIGTFPVSSTGEIYVDCGIGTGCDFPVETANITASYSGDASYNASTTTYQFTLERGSAAWATSVSNAAPTANTTDIAYVTFGELTDPLYPPTGSVSLTRSDTGAVLGTGTLDKTGTVTIPFNAGSGFYSLGVQWSGDTNYQLGVSYADSNITTYSTSGTIPVKVAFSMSGSSFTLGQATTYTVTVTPTQKINATPIGYVQLYVLNGPVSPFAGLTGGTPTPQTIELANGKATGVIHWTTGGVQTLYVVYEGDGNYAGASSSVSTATVVTAAPSIAVQTNGQYVATGAVTSVTAQLTNPLASLGVASPTGTIQFYNASNGTAATALGKPQLVVGGNSGALLATLSTTLPTGSNAITAKYSGDSNWSTVTAAAASAVVVTTPSFTFAPPSGTLSVAAGETASIGLTTQSILGYNTPIAITCGTLPAGVTCNTATITPGSSGSITLTTTAPGTATTQSSKNEGYWATSATLSLAGVLMFMLPHRRRLRYLAVIMFALGLATGVTGCSGGSSQPPSLSITSSSSKVASGGSVTFSATVNSGSNNGTVTFYSDTVALGNPVAIQNGMATLNTSSLSVGTHAVTATYSNSGSQQTTSSDTLEQTITGSFTVTLTATSGSNTQSVTVPVTLN